MVDNVALLHGILSSLHSDEEASEHQTVLRLDSSEDTTHVT